ncbi:MAG: PadR family transcriptional regulator [Firmicutes bacterium]|nr:PadR family transcriptional regulator [Bacillota bacterium]
MPKKSMETLTETMFYVLMAFSQGEMCGITVADYIEKRTDGRVNLGPATLYTILAKFESEGYIRETKVEGRKRTYAITDRGRKAYEEELKRLRQCIADAQAAAWDGILGSEWGDDYEMDGHAENRLEKQADCIPAGTVPTL